MNKKIKVVWLSIISLIVVTAICPNYSYALSSETVSSGKSIGGKLVGPVMDFFVTICDGIVDITQKVLFGVEGDAIVNVDRSGEWIPKVLGVIAVIAILAGSVALAVIFAPVTGVVATVAIGTGTAILTIGKAIKTYFVVTTIMSTMLNNSFQIPFIVISPENIIQNKVGMFNVNFFSENTNIDKNDNSLNISD